MTQHSVVPVSRRLRRRFVLIGAAGLLALVLTAFLQASGVERAFWLPLSVIGIVAMVFGWARFLFGLVGLPNPNEPELDERERTVVTRSYATAYRILGSLVVAVAAYVALSDLFPDLPTAGEIADRSGLLLALLWTVLGLPTAVLAWNEPDLEG